MTSGGEAGEAKRIAKGLASGVAGGLVIRVLLAQHGQGPAIHLIKQLRHFMPSVRDVLRGTQEVDQHEKRCQRLGRRPLTWIAASKADQGGFEPPINAGCASVSRTSMSNASAVGPLVLLLSSIVRASLLRRCVRGQVAVKRVCRWGGGH